MPTLGHSVIYTDPSGTERAAIVTAVWSADRVNLQAFPVSLFPIEIDQVDYGDTPGTWRWSRQRR